jgi:actin
MTSLLAERGYGFDSVLDTQIAHEIREKLGYVAADFEAEFSNASTERTYKVCSENSKFTIPKPMERSIVLSTERFICNEGLFRPSLAGFEFKGLHEEIVDVVSQCDIDLRRDMWSGFAVSGGVATTNGFAARLRKEVNTLVPIANLDIRVDDLT